jgi:hypothetical protein
MLIIYRVEEIVKLPDDLLEANEEAPSARVGRSFVPEYFGIIFTYAVLVFKKMLIFVYFFFKLVIFDTYEVSDCLVMILLI